MFTHTDLKKIRSFNFQAVRCQSSVIVASVQKPQTKDCEQTSEIRCGLWTIGPNVGRYLEDLMRTCVHAEQTPYVHIIDLFRRFFLSMCGYCMVIIYIHIHTLGGDTTCVIMKGTYRSPEETKDLLRLAISHLNTIAFGCNGLLKWLEPFRYDDITGYILYILIIQHTHVYTQAIA